jgi:hypothetical protein
LPLKSISIEADLDRDRVAPLRAQGFSIRQIAAKLGIGVGTAAGTLQLVPEVQRREVEQ